MKLERPIIYILTLALTLTSQSLARPLFSTFQLAHLALREGAQGSGSGAGIATDGIPVMAEQIAPDFAPTITLAPEQEEPTW